MADHLAGLNTSQREAAEHEGGPLLVLAGPGTGKTRVIAHRIAHLIAARGAEPESIVAVTYTVKAARQLTERLAGLVGHAAERVHTHTFHGLGLRIIRRFADEAGVSVRSSGESRGGIVDSAQQKKMLRAIIMEHGLFPRARPEGVNAAVDLVGECMCAMSDVAISPERARAFADEAEKRLDVGKAFDGSALDEQGMLAERERVRTLRESARAIELFEETCRERGLLTFADLITIPIRVLSRSGRAAAILRDEWRHMVVDEFQDANTAQIELLRLLMPPQAGGGEGLWEGRGGRGPDLCVVGDDDQSIYEFRGADDRAFQRFRAVWPGHTEVRLTQNYRSARTIVRVANSVIGRASDRYAPDKRIEAAGDRAGEAGPVECVHLENDLHDGGVIASMILLDRTERAGAEWSDYAVIVKTHNDAERCRAALELEGIPAVAAKEGSPASDPGVRDVLAWVRVLAEPRSVYHAARLMARPPISMDLARVQTLSSAYSAVLRRFEAGEPGRTDPGGVVDWLGGFAPEDPGVAKLAALHGELRVLAADATATEVIDRIVSLTGAAHADLLPARGRARRVRNLLTLVNFARARQDRLEPPDDVRAFCSYFEDLSDTERELRDTNVDDRVDGLSAQTEDDALDAVSVITAHSAKGLEFDTVFVPRVTPASGYGSAREREGPDLPEGLLRPGDPRTPRQRAAAEQRRLFYVACTRAERRLVLLSKKNKNPSSSTHYFEEILADDGLRDARCVRTAGEIYARAARLGLGRAALVAGQSDGVLNLTVAERRAELFEWARRETRRAAAGALDVAEGSSAEGVPPGQQAALRSAAERLAALAGAERTGAVPEWADGTDAGEFVQTLLARAEAGASPDDGAPAAPGLKPPLVLNFTAVNDYIRCPRCFYLKYVLRLRQRPAATLTIGNAVHKALERFYTEFRSADSTGGPKPDRDRLMTIGREVYFLASPRLGEADRIELDQVLAQLGVAFDRLHDAAANVVEVEKSVTFDYRGPGGTHRFTAKLDRLDQVNTASGGVQFRLVDYKTGRATETKTLPKSDDLQLGVYALALSHLHGSGDPAQDRLPGVAEYWVLSTGERGVLDLASVRFDKVRARIDKAIEGMLAGRWDSGKDCRGDCDILGL